MDFNILINNILPTYYYKQIENLIIKFIYFEYKLSMSNNLYLQIVKKNGEFLKYINEQTKEICTEAVKNYGHALNYVKEQTEEICLEAVKVNGNALMYVKGQTNEICLEAVKNYSYALEYVKEQTKEICLEAVKYGEALLYVKKQTKEICLEAVKQNMNAIEYVDIKYTKYMYNYLKSINFKNNEYYNFIINIDISDFKFLLNVSHDYVWIIKHLWIMKYIKQDLKLCKFVINNQCFKDNIYSYYSLINYKKPKLCLQIIKNL